MNVEAQLVKDIIRNPYDLSLKLIYADWLEDNYPVERADDISRIRDNNGTMVLEKGSGYVFHIKNGFVYGVTIHYNKFIKIARELFNNHPITEVNITGVTPGEDEFGIWYFLKIRVESVYPYLRGKLNDVNGTTCIDYPSKEAAIEDLEQACLEYGVSLIED